MEQLRVERRSGIDAQLEALERQHLEPPPPPSCGLTRRELREELQGFAEGELRSQLATLASLVQADLRQCCGERMAAPAPALLPVMLACEKNGGVGAALKEGRATEAQAVELPRKPAAPAAVNGRSIGGMPSKEPPDIPEMPTRDWNMPSITKAATVGRMLRSEVRLELIDMNLEDIVQMSDTKVWPDDGADGEQSQSVTMPKLDVVRKTTTRSADRAADTLDRVRSRMVTTVDPNCRRRRMWRIENSQYFEYGVMVVILANAVYIGGVTHYMSLQTTDNPPRAFDVIESIFLLLFLSELGLRVYVRRRAFFWFHLADGRRNPVFYWNVFDCAVIGLQAVEMLCRKIDINADVPIGVSVLRLLRLLRLGRIVRLVKVFRLVTDLRTIVYSIGNSLSLLFWSIVALLLVTYLWAVFLTEAVWGHKLNAGPDADLAMLDEKFGSLERTMLSLLQSITGGCDWGDLSKPLEDLGYLFGLFPFLAYIFFAVLAMMNVITGVFLETASERAKEEREIFLMRNARNIFSAADHNSNGTITWTDFQQTLDKKGVSQFFEAIELDVSEAETLFELLDTSGDGAISSDEFLCGCLRLRGHAKALDLLVLSRDVSRMFDLNKESLLCLHRSIDELFRYRQAVPLLSDTPVPAGAPPVAPPPPEDVDRIVGDVQDGLEKLGGEPTIGRQIS